MIEKKWLVPNVIDPAEKVCVQFEIPNDVKHLAAFWGALDRLSKAYNWEDSFDDGSQTAYVWRDVISVAAQAVRIGENCIMPIDCEEVEECLEGSEIVLDLREQDTVIFSSLLDLDDNMVQNSNDIQEINDHPPDGNTYDPPVPEPQTDIACQISGHLASKVGDYIAQIDTYSDEPTLLDALDSAMNGDGYYAVTELIEALNNFFVGGADPLFSDYQSQQDEVHEWLYCENNFSKDDLATWSVENLTRGQEISDMLDSIALSTWEQWQVLGQHATEYDCSSFICGTWCYRFDDTNGWDGWNIVRGDQSGGVLNAVNWSQGNDTFKGYQLSLDLSEIAGITEIRAHMHLIEEGIVNTVVLWQIWTLAGAEGHNEIVGGNYNTAPTERDTTVDATDWQDVRITGNVAAKSNGSYPLPASGHLEFIEISGIGANPFGEDNC